MGVVGILDNVLKINCNGIGFQVWLRIVVKMFLKKVVEKIYVIIIIYVYTDQEEKSKLLYLNIIIDF